MSPTPNKPKPLGETTLVPAMRLALEANFGSWDQWRDDLAAHGHRAAAHQGTVQLLFQPHDGRLVHRSNTQQPATQRDAVVLLSLQIPAHTGPSAAADMQATVDGIDWAAPYAAYQHAVHEASPRLAAQHADVQDAPAALVLDVRRAGVFAQALHMLPGAQWRDPARVADWAAELPCDRPVLVYCIYGHEVGRATALRLAAAGVQARFLEGGIDGWLTAGRPVVAKPQAGPAQRG